MNITKNKNISWIDIKNPSKKDLVYLKKNFHFHPVTLGELLLPTLRPKVENYDDYLYMVLHFPIYDPEKRTAESVEIDFLIKKDTLITVRYEKLLPLEKFWFECQTNKIVRERDLSQTTAFLLYAILECLYEFSLRQIDHITKKINQIEEEMFKNKGSEKMVGAISLVQRDILDFQKAIRPQKDILNSLEARGVNYFGEKMRPYFTDIIGDYMQVWVLSESHKETVQSLKETNASLVANRTSQIIRILTIFSVVIFPLTLLSSVFGMNTTYLPFVGYKYDFWIIFGIMLLATLGMLAIFKKKKWL